MLFQRGAVPEAERHFLKSLEVIRKLQGDEFPGLDDLINGIAEILRSQNKFDEAGKLHREALALRRKLFGDEHEKVAISLNNVAIVLQGQGNHSEAERMYRDALTMLMKLGGADPGLVRIVGSNLIYALQLQRKPDEIAQVERELAPVVESHNRAALEAAGPVVSVIVPPDARWRWLHPTDGVDPSSEVADFHESFFLAEFDDSKWNSGVDSSGPKGGFAYGEEDFEGVDIGQPEPGIRYSAYLRLKFKTTREIGNLELRFRRDDGAIAYLDGKEVVRDNVEQGPDSYRLAATNPISWLDENMVQRHPIPGSLPAGDHVLAFSIHNRGDGSSDLRLAEITLVELGAE